MYWFHLWGFTSRSRVCHLILAPMRQASDRGTEPPLRIDRRGERRPSGDGAPSNESTAAANDGLDLLGVEADFVGGGSVPRSLACPVNANIKWHTRSEESGIPTLANANLSATIPII